MSDYAKYPRTCRLCGERAWAWDMVKYGTRNYAHFACFVERKTMADIEALPAWPRQQLNLWRQTKAGRAVIAKVEAEEAREEAEARS